MSTQTPSPQHQTCQSCTHLVRKPSPGADISVIKMAEMGWHNCNLLPRCDFVARAECRLQPSRYQPIPTSGATS